MRGGKVGAQGQKPPPRKGGSAWVKRDGATEESLFRGHPRLPEAPVGRVFRPDSGSLSPSPRCSSVLLPPHRHTDTLTH